MNFNDIFIIFGKVQPFAHYKIMSSCGFLLIFSSLLQDIPGHVQGVAFEFVPCDNQLGLQCNDEAMSGGQVGGILLDLLDIVQQVEAHGILTGREDGLGHTGSLLLVGEPQGGTHAGGVLTVLLHGLAGSQILGQFAVGAPALLGTQLIDRIGYPAVEPVRIVIQHAVIQLAHAFQEHLAAHHDDRLGAVHQHRLEGGKLEMTDESGIITDKGLGDGAEHLVL